MTQSKLSQNTLWIRGILVTVIASALNVVVAMVASTAVGASPTFLALTPGPVAFLTGALMLGGTLVYSLLTRFTKRPDVWFLWIAGAVALLSLAAPIALAIDPTQVPERLGEASTQSALALIPLHLIPASALIGALRWRNGPNPAAVISATGND